MRRFAMWSAVAVVSALALPRAQQNAPTVTPGVQAAGPQTRFKAGVDIVETSAIVLDKNRKPIKGLTERDFTIFEDGVLRPIVAFSAETLPAPVVPSAPWMQTVASDVDSNTEARGRLIVIIIDDANNFPPLPHAGGGGGVPAQILLPSGRSVGGGGGGRGQGGSTTGPVSAVYSFEQTKQAARRAIDGLGPTDEAAVIFTSTGWDGQSFTSDHARLVAAVERTRLTPPISYSGCSALLASAEALLQATDALASVPHRMKLVLYVSVGLQVGLMGPQSSPCAETVQGLTQRAVHSAQLGNVLVYSVDPTGLYGAPLTGGGGARLNFLTDVSENTGARALLRTNNVALKVPGLLEETNSYYLLGYERSGPARDGQFYRLEVKLVGHPDWQVAFRRLRQDAPPESSGRLGVTPTEAAIEGYAPESALPISVSVAPFAATQDAASVQVTLRIALPANAPVMETDQEDVLVRAFTIDGRSIAQSHQSTPVPVILRPASGDQPRTQQTNVSLQMNLAPGRYALRIGVRSVGAGTVGSVYTDLTVPDFFKEPISLSGSVLLASSGSFPIQPRDLSTLVPIVARTFARDDHVSAFLRVYRGVSAPAADVTVHSRIVDSQNHTVLDRRELLPLAAFANAGHGDYSLRLPFETLKPGKYCLTIDATSGASVARRDVIFNIQ